MIKSKFENEIIETMDKKLSHDDLQNVSQKLQIITDKIYKSAYIFKKSGMIRQSNKLQNILHILSESIKKNNSLKNISASIENVYERVDLNSAEDMLKLDFGDINLTEDEIRQIESGLLEETDTFEDEND